MTRRLVGVVVVVVCKIALENVLIATMKLLKNLANNNMAADDALVRRCCTLCREGERKITTIGRSVALWLCLLRGVLIS